MNKTENDLRSVLALKYQGQGQKNYSIKAGAGGGKTTLLSFRICQQIVSGTSIEEFVIITYTNAAAAELREKISNQLRKIAQSKSAKDYERETAQEALNSIELIQISTIHAFLLRILREYAFDAGIVLDAKMLEEEEADKRKEDFFNSWYRDHYSDFLGFSDDWTVVTKTTNTAYDVTRTVFRNMFFDLASVRETIVYDPKDPTDDIARMAKRFVEKWLPELSRYKVALVDNWPKETDGSHKSLRKGAPQNILDGISAIEISETYGIEEACLLSDVIGLIKANNDSGDPIYGKKYDDSGLEDVLPTIPEWDLEWNFRELYSKYLIDSQKSSRAVEYTIMMQKAYQNKYDKEALTISNNDILFRAERLLVEHPDVLDKLRNRYSKIYVDEFQDTTGLQARLVKMLSEKTETEADADDLADDKLIVVGDPKQSIYRFTGAEKAVYDEFDTMLADMPDDRAQSVSLNTNFRSNKIIVDWVNTSFSKLMASDYSPMDTEWIVSEPNALCGVFRYEPTLKLKDNGKYASYDRENDVKSVVDLVRTLVDNNRYFLQIPVRNEDGTFGPSFLRRIYYSDFMIICRTATHIGEYVKEFAKYGIPVNVQGKFLVKDDEILRNFVLLTEYFAEYKNKKKRITAEQIICGFDATSVSTDELKNAGESLRELRVYFQDNSMDCAAIMRYLLSHEELFLPKGKQQSVERVREYRIRLNQMVETCLANNDGDLSRLADLMNDYMENEIKRQIPLESNENAVKLMNVHKAKGLTGQIVIIADRSFVEECRYNGFKKNGKYYPAVRYKVNEHVRASDTIVPSFGCSLDVLKQAYMDETEEALRLQYVAATRAAHALIFMPEIGRKVWFSDRQYELDRLPDIVSWLKERESDDKEYEVKDDIIDPLALEMDLRTLDDNRKKIDDSILDGVQNVSITPSGLEHGGVTGYTPNETGYIKEDRPSGDVFGAVMHRVYELITMRYNKIRGLASDAREKEFETIINQAILEKRDEMRASDDPKAFFEYLKTKMTGYYEKIMVPILDGAEELYPEYTFSFFVGDYDRASFLAKFFEFMGNVNEGIEIKSEPIWINGQADLVVKRKDGSVKVYDYKSDAMNGKSLKAFEESLSKKYEGQLALYRYAIGKSFGVDNVETEVIHLYK